MQNTPQPKENHMKKSLAAGWNALGTTGRIFLVCFVIYFLGKISKR